MAPEIAQAHKEMISVEQRAVYVVRVVAGQATSVHKVQMNQYSGKCLYLV